MTPFTLKIIASASTFYQGDCESLILPTSDGQYGILAYHEPVVVAIRMGEMRFQVGGEWRDVVIGDGFARVRNNSVTILADSAERPEDVDENRAREAMQRAQERLQHQASMREYYDNKIALGRAMTRLRAAQHRKPK